MTDFANGDPESFKTPRKSVCVKTCAVYTLQADYLHACAKTSRTVKLTVVGQAVPFVSNLCDRIVIFSHLFGFQF